MLVASELSQQSGTLKRRLRDATVSHSLLESVSLEEIADVHFPICSGSRPQRTRAQDFRVLVQLIRDFEILRSSANLEDQFRWFKMNRQKQVEELIQRLSRHAVLGHYFFETLDVNSLNPKGYVCLLREVTVLPRQIAEKLGRGISKGEYDAAFATSESAQLVLDHDELAMPIIEVGSPTIEHVLQSFSYLFGRIGVPEPSDETIRKITSQFTTADGGPGR